MNILNSINQSNPIVAITPKIQSTNISSSENSSQYLPQIDYEALSEYLNLLEDIDSLSALRVFDAEYYYAIYVSDSFYAKYKSDINRISKHILNKYSDIYTQNIICFSESERIEELKETELFIKNKKFGRLSVEHVLSIQFEISAILPTSDKKIFSNKEGYSYAA